MNANDIIKNCKEQVRERIVQYTTRAFHLLPVLERPLILDIGCGAGAPSVELARLSKGHVVAFDIDQSSLDKFREKVKMTSFAGKISIVYCSLLALSFFNEIFDIIWAEGSIMFIGFEKGLREWKPWLKPNGYLVIHDDVQHITKKLELIHTCGYKLITYFHLSKEIWWDEYYKPLQEEFDKLRVQHADDEEFLELLDPEQEEIDNVRKSPERHASVFFIMKK
ncbi:MAG: hypothetical protein A2Y62_15100 [Candidatus Fischerbacteria bacterium RBG_13_37_8]|uniref:Methyltransferase domain-containing protein n=1 Tax=Candidatus Fischerbacteria bacterium RBG_13_37_8 TaxID=1817863 RepID=A0A1F5VD52_9BACT|nr:MAG: hypothetical protein A2Y62_15100 [Candidatus Fischerbacteria bacterium RBG_13_37_8]